MPTPNVNSYPDPFSGDAILADWGEAVDLDIRYLYTAVGSGAADASASAKGITKLSVAPVSSTNPIAVGDNDPRVPTTNEAAALVGSSGAPSAINPYVTESDARLPTAGEAAALAGTSGTPGSGNKYVTDDDPRLAGLGPGGLIMIRDSFTADKAKGFTLTGGGASYTVTAGKILYVVFAQISHSDVAGPVTFTVTGGSAQNLIESQSGSGIIGCKTIPFRLAQTIDTVPIPGTLSNTSVDTFDLGSVNGSFAYDTDYIWAFPAGTVITHTATGTNPTGQAIFSGFEV